MAEPIVNLSLLARGRADLQLHGSVHDAAYLLKELWHLTALGELAALDLATARDGAHGAARGQSGTALRSGAPGGMGRLLHPDFFGRVPVARHGSPAACSLASHSLWPAWALACARPARSP